MASQESSDKLEPMRFSLNRALTWLALLLPWGMLVAYLQDFWRCSPQYQYGWLVIPLGLRLFLLRWNSLAEKPRTAGIGASGSVILFVLLISPLWLARQATTHWSVPGYGLTALVCAYSLAMLGLMGGWKLARQMAIPILFIFCAVKLPLTPEQWMIQSLSRFVAKASVVILHLFEIPALNSGNLVILHRGIIGISEACSGIHSLQSLLMVALFLGEERRMRASLRFLMVGLGVTLSITLNVARILILSVICLVNGMTDFERWHDSAGWSILMISLGLMIFVANELGGKVKIDGKGPPPSLRPIPTWIAAFACFWFALTIGGSEAWYRMHDAPARNTTQVEVQWPSSNPSYTPLEIPDRIRDITLCTSGQSGRWKEEDGSEWTLALLEFGGGHKGTSQWAPMHTPDICFPAAGMPLLRSHPPMNLRVAGGKMDFLCWEFKQRNSTIIVFFSIHDEANHDSSDPFVQDLFGVNRIVEGRRNLGQQSVEFAISGYENYEAALEVFKHRLPQIIKLQRPADVSTPRPAQ